MASQMNWEDSYGNQKGKQESCKEIIECKEVVEQEEHESKVSGEEVLCEEDGIEKIFSEEGSKEIQ